MSVLEAFAGPGGLSESARMVGVTGALGIELNKNACATAKAAGHRRRRCDIRTLDPNQCTQRGWISAPPCQTQTLAGKGSGRADYQLIVDAVPVHGHSFTVPGDERRREFHPHTYGAVADDRTALVMETLEFAICMPRLRWLVAEQVLPVRGIWMEFAMELVAFHRFTYAAVVTLKADDFGAATRRARAFFIATRGYVPDLEGLPMRAWWECSRFGSAPQERQPNRMSPFPLTSMAAALGWPAEVEVNTRGDRKTAGGNVFKADVPAPALTQSTRTWFRTDMDSESGRLTSAQAGVLQGFPAEYPWQGSRTSQFQQAADSVAPLVGAAVVGAAAGLPWEDAVWRRLEDIYPVQRPAEVQLRLCDDQKPSGQLDLFGEAAA